MNRLCDEKIHSPVAIVTGMVRLNNLMLFKKWLTELVSILVTRPSSLFSILI